MRRKASPARRLRLAILNDSPYVLKFIRATPSLQSQPFVITTRNKRKLEQVVGRTSAVEIAGEPEDLRRLLKAVETAGLSASER